MFYGFTSGLEEIYICQWFLPWELMARAFVHFSVGVSGILLLFTLINLDNRREFLLMFFSGFWAVIPDIGWLLLRINMPTAANIWKAVFNSPLGNIFWFHPFIDANEPENRVVEMTSGFILLGVAVITYYFANDWKCE